MSFLAVSTSIGISTNSDKKYQAQRMHKSPHNRMWAHHYAISKLGAPVRQKSNTRDPHAVQSLGGGRLLGYLVVHVDVDSRRRELEKYGKYTRFTNAKRAIRIVTVRGSYKEVKNPNSTLKADSEDFCNKGIATLCVSRLSPVALGCRCFVSFALFLTDAARRLFTALPFFPIAR